MTRFLLSLAAALFASAAAPAQEAAPDGAQRQVVVELFTSQGCSSCPPADALLAELAARDDVIALALHVDYWDYIGWKDTFADPAFTARQKGYAKAHGRRMVYTPQMIVGGVHQAIGTKGMKVADLIAHHRDVPQQIALDVARGAGQLSIAAQVREAVAGPLNIHVVRYRDKEQVTVRKGENAGRTLDYSNIVTDWHVAGQWDGVSPLSLELPIEGDQPVVVIVQHAGHGAIVAAAELD